MASLLDIQSFYLKAGLSQVQFPPERLATGNTPASPRRSSARS